MKILHETRSIAYNNHSQLTAMMGRRRIGKTTLVKRSCAETSLLYLFVNRTTERNLCQNYRSIVESVLNIPVASGIDSFVDLFELIMQAGKTQRFTLFIDEFQEFLKINPSIYSGIQDIWDRYKDDSHVHFIAGGSVQTMMHKVFLEYGEPLYGRCDSIIRLKSLTPSVIKQIIADYHPTYTNDDLLALYTFTGGVPKYIELLVDHQALSVHDIIQRMLQPDSPFLEEGNILLIQEFGKDYGKYFAILSSIASGINVAGELAKTVGLSSVTGHLTKLEEDYELISKKRPVMAKPGSQTVRYEIRDNFLRFWFRYIYKYQSYLQSEMHEQLAKIIEEDYAVFSGLALEKYFREKLVESHQYYLIGSWWEAVKRANDNPNEIDIVAIKPGDQEVLLAEVKRNPRKFRPEDFARKVDTFKTKVMPKAAISSQCLSLEDM